ncbi:MAG: anti-sigma factor, partial [Pirellulaceae bacterium]
MRNPVTDELVSAYIDGEVTADEGAQVERALAESAECRQLFEELQSLGSSLRSLPRFVLPGDFHQRVLRQAERAVLLPEPDAEPVSSAPAVTSSDPSRRALRTWQTIALSAAAVAAALFFALMVVARRHDIPTSGGPQTPQDNLVTTAPDRGVPEGVELPRENLLADSRGGLRHRPTYVLVIDLTISPKGQRNRVFENALQNAGIQFDPSVTVDEDLEEILLRSRFLEDVEKAGDETEKQAAADDITMVYVTGMGLALDAAITDLMRKRPRDEIAWVKLDMAMEPKKRAVFEALDDSLRFAGNEPSTSPRARRLVFRFSLHTASGGFLASFP